MIDTKELTAFFTDAEKAGIAAFDLSENFPYCKKITVSNGKFSDICLQATFTGAFWGVFIGIVLHILSGNGNFSAIFPLSGLISGCVIGAISGCILEFLRENALSAGVNVTVTLPENKSGIISHLLRKKGATKTFFLNKK